jgi:hypothetical protein
LADTPPVFPCCLHYFSHFKSSIRGIIRRTTVLIFALHQLAPSVGKRFVFSHFVSLPEELRTVDSNSFSLMEAGDTSAQHLSASERQMQAVTANVQELARQSPADRREIQELTKQNQELIALLHLRGEIPNLSQGQNGGEGRRNEEERYQNQD